METSTLGLSISTSISMEFLQGPPGVPRTPQDYIWRSPSIPRDVLGVATDALRLLSDALEMHLEPPCAPQGLPRHTPGRLLHAQASTEPPNGHPMTLFPRSKVYQDDFLQNITENRAAFFLQRRCSKPSNIPHAGTLQKVSAIKQARKHASKQASKQVSEQVSNRANPHR